MNQCIPDQVANDPAEQQRICIRGSLRVASESKRHTMRLSHRRVFAKQNLQEGTKGKRATLRHQSTALKTADVERSLKQPGQTIGAVAESTHEIGIAGGIRVALEMRKIEPEGVQWLTQVVAGTGQETGSRSGCGLRLTRQGALHRRVDLFTSQFAVEPAQLESTGQSDEQVDREQSSQRETSSQTGQRQQYGAPGTARESVEQPLPISHTNAALNATAVADKTLAHLLENRIVATVAQPVEEALNGCRRRVEQPDVEIVALGVEHLRSEGGKREHPHRQTHGWCQSLGAVLHRLHQSSASRQVVLDGGARRLIRIDRQKSLKNLLLPISPDRGEPKFGHRRSATRNRALDGLSAPRWRSEVEAWRDVAARQSDDEIRREIGFAIRHPGQRTVAGVLKNAEAALSALQQARLERFALCMRNVGRPGERTCTVVETRLSHDKTAKSFGVLDTDSSLVGAHRIKRADRTIEQTLQRLCTRCNLLLQKRTLTASREVQKRNVRPRAQ